MVKQFIAVWVLFVAQAASAQNFTTAIAPGAKTAFITAADPDRTGPLFISEAPLDAEPEPAGSLRTSFGFHFMRPIFSDHQVALPVAAPAGGFVVGDVSNLSPDFAASPIFKIAYEFPSGGYGVQASAWILNLSGNIDRTATVVGANQNVNTNASSSTTINVANFVEGFGVVFLEDSKWAEHTHFNDTEVTYSIGFRTASVEQRYTANVTFEGNQTNLVGNTKFTGFGVTSSFSGLHPLHLDQEGAGLAFYSHLRGSLLIGQSIRDSSINTNMAEARTAKESITRLIPAMEAEFGIKYGTRFDPSKFVPRPALVWFQTGLTGQYWGDVGLLRINDSMGGQFTSTNLLLVGFTVQIGVDY